jgi:hypothetical protein
MIGRDGGSWENCLLTNRITWLRLSSNLQLTDSENGVTMNSVPQIVPVSELRMKHVEIFGLLGYGPVVLAQRSRPAAVLVSVGDWNKLTSELDQLRDLVDVLEAEVENAGAEPESVDFAELQRMAAGDAIPA